MVTSTVRIRNGDQALKIRPGCRAKRQCSAGQTAALAVTTALEVTPAICAPAVRLGCQTFRNRVRKPGWPGPR